jgi:hypothetical protein
MRKILLQLISGLILLSTALAGAMYAGFMVIWMHAPVASVLLVTLAMASIPLLLSWWLLKLSGRQHARSPENAT